mgnify:CR=1 FL=1
MLGAIACSSANAIGLIGGRAMLRSAPSALSTCSNGRSWCRSRFPDDGRYALERLSKGRIAGEVGPQRHEVDEEPDHVRDRQAIPSGDRRHHRHVVVAGPTREQHLPRGERRDERRHAFTAGKRSDGLDQGRRQLDRPGRTATRTSGVAAAISRYGAPSSCRRQYAASDAPRSPRYRSRCHSA